jgi:hypothetical protein
MAIQLPLPLSAPPTLPVVAEPFSAVRWADRAAWRADVLARVAAALPAGSERDAFRLDTIDCPGWALEVARREGWLAVLEE